MMPAAAKQDPEYHIIFSYRPSATLNPRFEWWLVPKLSEALVFLDSAVDIGVDRMLPSPRVNRKIPRSDVASGGLSPG